MRRYNYSGANQMSVHNIELSRDEAEWMVDLIEDNEDTGHDYIATELRALFGMGKQPDRNIKKTREINEKI